METLEKIMELATSAKNDENIKGEYSAAVSEYLKNTEMTKDVIDVVVAGIEADRGANFLEYVESLSEEQLQTVWDIVKSSNAYKNNTGVLKLLFGMLVSGFYKLGKVESLIGKLMTAIVNLTVKNKQGEPIDASSTICDYFISEIVGIREFPEWKSIKIADEYAISFAMYIRGFLDEKVEYVTFKRWLIQGIDEAEKSIEHKNLEAKIPKSKIKELQDIVEHYKAVDEQVRTSVYEIDRLEKLLQQREKEISELQSTKNELESTIRRLNGDVEEQKEVLRKAEQEIDERRALNEAQVKFREDSQSDFLQEVAKALRVEFGDFFVTETAPMNEVLGEIYREKIKNIAKILDAKGIKVK